MIIFFIVFFFYSQSTLLIKAVTVILFSANVEVINLSQLGRFHFLGSSFWWLDPSSAPRDHALNLPVGVYVTSVYLCG